MLRLKEQQQRIQSQKAYVMPDGIITEAIKSSGLLSQAKNLLSFSIIHWHMKKTQKII